MKNIIQNTIKLNITIFKMVRACAVYNCEETDATLLSHRFPKKEEICEVWQNALKLQKVAVQDLMKKNVVCTRHFTPKDYRNKISNHLNTTAVPNLNLNPNNHRANARKDTPQPSIKKINTSQTNLVILPKSPKLQRVLNTQLEKKQKQSNHEDYNFEIVTIQADEPEAKKIKIIEDVIIVEELEETPKEAEIHSSDNSTQTDSPPEIKHLPEPVFPSVASIDDEFISTFYPEFAGFSKQELIEKLIESNRKVEVASEKLEKYEKVIKNLMKNK